MGLWNWCNVNSPCGIVQIIWWFHAIESEATEVSDTQALASAVSTHLLSDFVLHSAGNTLGNTGSSIAQTPLSELWLWITPWDYIPGGQKREGGEKRSHNNSKKNLSVLALDYFFLILANKDMVKENMCACATCVFLPGICAESYLTIAFVIFCLPTWCEVIFHLSHVDYDAINLDSDRQGTP